MNTLDAFEVVPTGAALGAEIRGVDLALPVSDDVARALREAWYPILRRGLARRRSSSL